MEKILKRIENGEINKSNAREVLFFSEGVSMQVITAVEAYLDGKIDKERFLSISDNTPLADLADIL